MHVRIFDKAVTAQDFLKRHRTVQTGDAYIRCLADGFNLQFGPNGRVRLGEANGKAPGSSQRVRPEVEAPGIEHGSARHPVSLRSRA